MRHRRGALQEDELMEKEDEIARLRAELQVARGDVASLAPSPAASSQSPASVGNRPMRADDSSRELAEKLVEAVRDIDPNKVKGLSNQAKTFKDKLVADPYNLEFIYKLGLAYAMDNHWEQSCNVLLRGFKRVDEFVDPSDAFDFLLCLAEASQRIRKFRQAAAVLREIAPHEDPERMRSLQAMRCAVCCENGDCESGLKAFSEAIRGRTFDEALATWSSCLSSMRRAGAHELSKAILLELASDDEDKARLSAMEQVIAIRDSLELPPCGGGGRRPPTKARLSMTLRRMLLAAAVAVLVFVLYLLEAKNLERLRLVA